MDSNQDITQTILNTINEIFNTLFSSITDSLYDVLDKLVFISSDILTDKNFEVFFGTSSSNGILLIANSLLLGFLIYFSARYLLSHITYSQIERPISFLFKLMLYGIFMNFSFYLIEIFLSITSNISLAILDIGESMLKTTISFSNLITELNFSDNNDSLDIFSLDGIIQSTISFSLLNLIFTYSLRYITVKVFILLAPFAFLSLSLESSSWFFKAWAKTLFSLMFIQVLVSIILVLLFSMDYSSSDLFVKFIYIGGIYALIRANSTVRDFIGGLSTTVQQNVNNIISR